MMSPSGRRLGQHVVETIAETLIVFSSSYARSATGSSSKLKIRAPGHASRMGEWVATMN
jgi:hypothetical protein